MTKKFFLIVSTIFALLLIHSTVFAIDNTVHDTANNVGNEMKNSWDKLGNTMQNVGNTVKTGISNMGKDNNNTDNRTGFMGMTENNNNNNNGAYTATRTSTDTPTAFGMDGTMWTWLILAILAVTIISLVWYYGVQKSDDREDHQS